MDKTTEKQIDTEIAERVKADCTSIDREARFSEMIDECYSFVDVGGPFAHMTPSRVLLEVDVDGEADDFDDSDTEDGESSVVAALREKADYIRDFAD